MVAKYFWLVLWMWFFTTAALAEDREYTDEDFLEFLGEFGEEDEWIDPLEIEAWADKRLKNDRDDSDKENREIEHED